MPESQTSLQEAMARIMGAPAGGNPPAPTALQNATNFATPAYSGSAPAPRTDVSVTNTPFDPYAGERAALATAQAALAAPAAKPVVAATPITTVSSPWGQLSGANAENYQRYLDFRVNPTVNPTATPSYFSTPTPSYFK